MTHSRPSSQKIIRDYGSRKLSFIDKIALPFKAEQRMGLVKVKRCTREVQSLARQIELIKEDDLPRTLFSEEPTPLLEVVSMPSTLTLSSCASPQ